MWRHEMAGHLAPLLIPLLLTAGGTCQELPQLAISVNVDLVVFQATVQDRMGVPVADLNKEDFSVVEDGVPQSIRLFRHDDIPVTAGLIVDHSGSMRLKLASAVEAARAFVHLSNAEDEMFVINFNETVTSGLGASVQFSSQQDQLAAAVAGAGASGTTALYDALMEGLDRLRAGTSEKKVLLVISDGADNASRHTLQEVLDLALRLNAAIYTIGVFDEADPDRNPRVLRKLADTTGGEAFLPSPAQDLAAICRRIASGIRRQYTIGYFSHNVSAKAGFRKVRLTARSGRMIVRTRSGYFSGEAK